MKTETADGDPAEQDPGPSLNRCRRLTSPISKNRDQNMP
jgi:hypothetical protein